MSTKENCHPGEDVSAVDRRDFLRVSSTAAVVLAATNLHSGVLTIELPPSPLLSVGYWNGTLAELSGKAETTKDRRPIDAARLGGDGSLMTDRAQMTMHGFWRAASHRKPVTLTMRVMSPALEPAGGKASFVAWSWRPGMRLANQSRFDVGGGETLRLGVEHVDQSLPARRVTNFFGPRAASRSRAEVATMSPAALSNSVALRRGVYFFALREHESERAPDWASLRVAHGPAALDPKTSGALELSTLNGGRPAPFSYLVLSIDAIRA